MAYELQYRPDLDGLFELNLPTDGSPHTLPPDHAQRSADTARETDGLECLLAMVPVPARPHAGLGCVKSYRPLRASRGQTWWARLEMKIACDAVSINSFKAFEKD